jgi:hypothetical protein
MKREILRRRCGGIGRENRQNPVSSRVIITLQA